MRKYEKFIIKKEFLKFSNDRDIIIDFKSGDFYKIIQLNKKAKKICWLHNEITKVVNYEKRKIKLEKFFNDCEKIICICNEMKENLKKEMPMLKNKIEVIYNCFDIEHIENEASNTRDLSEYEKKLIKDEYFIMVSRLEEKMKDFKTLIYSYKKLCIKNLNYGVKLYLLGDGPDREKIEKLLKQENLDKEVILLGAKKNPYPWIKEAEILIHSSKFEGLPTVLIEALILGKKIISTNCPTGPKEILENGKVGRLVQVSNIQEMTQAIEEELNKRVDMKKLKEARKRFDGNVIIKEIENLFFRELGEKNV